MKTAKGRGLTSLEKSIKMPMEKSSAKISLPARTVLTSQANTNVNKVNLPVERMRSLKPGAGTLPMARSRESSAITACLKMNF